MHPVMGLFIRAKDVAVIGGGNSALDDALLLSEICNKVYLIHRRAEFRGDASTLAKLEQKENVEIIRNAKVQEITGNEKSGNPPVGYGNCIEYPGRFRGNRNDPTDRSSQRSGGIG